MKNIEISKEQLTKIKDIGIFILLLLWIIVPVLKCLSITYEFIILSEYVLMAIIGITGIYLGSIIIYNKAKGKQNKKEILKELLPIVILVLYMIWTLISSVFAENQRFAFYGTTYRKDGYVTYIIYAGIFLCTYLLESKKLRKVLLNVFIVVSIFLIITCRIPIKVIDKIQILKYNSVEHSVFSQFNHYGYYLVVSLMCCFGLFVTEKNKFIKVIYLIAYTIIGYATIYNNTFGCYLASAITLIVYGIYSLIKRKNRIVTLITIVIFIILSYTVTKDDKIIAGDNINNFITDVKTIITKINYSNQKKEDNKKEEQNINQLEVQSVIQQENINVEKQEVSQNLTQNVTDEQIEQSFEQVGTQRMKLWKYGIQFILEKPFIGYGPENLEEKYKSVGIEQDRPHNLLIQLATTSGIPGMILYVTAVGIIVIRGVKKLKYNDSGTVFLIVVTTYLISAMFGNSMYYTSPYFFIFLGFLMNCNSNKREE